MQGMLLIVPPTCDLTVPLLGFFAQTRQETVLFDGAIAWRVSDGRLCKEL